MLDNLATLQVYQVLLDSRFEPQTNHLGESGGTCGERCSTLDLGWSVSSGKTSPGVCEWRVSRSRLGESEFTVKEGIGSEEGMAGWKTSIDDTELRDGYR